MILIRSSIHSAVLVGELKAINIKANTHAGEWDMDKLAEWTADLKIDLSLDLDYHRRAGFFRDVRFRIGRAAVERGDEVRL